MAFTGNEIHDIDPKAAGSLTAAFRGTLHDPNDHTAVFFGKQKLIHMLNQNGCVGIRFYFAHDANNRITLVGVGADGSENDIIGEVAEFALPCPSRCSNSNVLNT